jgi:hypothetical protein
MTAALVGARVLVTPPSCEANSNGMLPRAAGALLAAVTGVV